MISALGMTFRSVPRQTIMLMVLRSPPLNLISPSISIVSLLFDGRSRPESSLTTSTAAASRIISSSMIATASTSIMMSSSSSGTNGCSAGGLIGVSAAISDGEGSDGTEGIDGTDGTDGAVNTG